MDEPICNSKAPYAIDVEEGKTYYYCACGRSQKEPFCDGSHKGTTLKPLLWTAKKTGPAFFCGCRKSKTTPLCDGAHADI